MNLDPQPAHSPDVSSGPSTRAAWLRLINCDVRCSGSAARWKNNACAALECGWARLGRVANDITSR